MNYRVRLSNGFTVNVTAESEQLACWKAEDTPEAIVGGEEAEAVEVEPISDLDAFIDGFVADYFTLEALARRS